jgi:hypothetical protein
VPGRVHHVGRDRVPGALVVGCDVRPATRPRDGDPDRRRHAVRRRAPGARAGAGRGARRAVGPGRGDDRRGPLPGRYDRHRVRAGPGIDRDRGHAEALRGLFGVTGRSQPRTGVDGPPRVRRRDPPAVRDGGGRGRGPVGHAFVRRGRRRARRGEPRAPDRSAPRHLGLRRHGRRRLLRRRLPGSAARRGRDARRGGHQGAERTWAR